MTTFTIRAALDTFQRAANRGTAVYLSLELVQELRDALKAEPEGEPPRPTFLDAIRLAQGCHDYSGGHSGQQGEAFHDGVGTVVAVLKKAAVGSWDSQTMAVFGVGSAPQTGEGE